MSPEFRLLAACCAGQKATPDQVQVLRALAPPDTDWAEVLRLVKRHRVAGLVFVALQSANIKLPAEPARQLAVAALKIRRHNASAAAETVALQRVFDRASIPIKFFKGAALAQQLYGSLDSKHSKDIDLLVPPGRAKDAVGVLAQRGYRMWLPASRLSDRQWSAYFRFNKEVAMVDPSTGLQVEPHWRLTLNAKLLRHLDASSPGEQVELPGYGSVRTFRQEDNFAYLCVHGTETGWVRLKWLADVHASLVGVSSTEIEARFRHAAEMGVGPSAALTLALCERIFGLAIPTALQGEIRRNWALRELERRALKKLADPVDDQRLREYLPTLLLMAWLHRCLSTQLMLALVGSNDVLALPLPRLLHFLYPALRLPLGVIRRARGHSRPPDYPTVGDLAAGSVTAPPLT